MRPLLPFFLSSLFSVLVAGSPLATPKPADGCPHPPACKINWNGTNITGALEADVCRYTVRYGVAGRWEYSLPAGRPSTKASAHPPMCPQLVPLGSALPTPMGYSEDCLYMTVYAPRNATHASKLPVFVWIHGGSFTDGSITDSGLNGTTLARDSGIITVFVQYRLGLLGYLPPPSAPTSPDPNFGLNDVLLALEVVRDNIGRVGGDAGKVTVAGQSSGATMARSLLVAPRGKGLFRGIILHSDPLIFGTQSPYNEQQLQALTYSATQNCTTFECYKSLPLKDILDMQLYTLTNAHGRIPSIPFGEILRPQFGTVTLPLDPTNALFYAPTLDLDLVPILFSTMRNDSGHVVQGAVKVPLPASPELYAMGVNELVANETQTSAILASGEYPLLEGPDSLRASMDILLTDGVWRCATRHVARQAAARGANVWVGEWTRGEAYTYNHDGYCTTPGAVCHGDDIYPVFGSAPNASATNLEFESTVRNYWAAFIHTSNPTSFGQPWLQWTARSTVSDVRNLGDGAPVADCAGRVFGTIVPWKWQTDSNATIGVLGAGPWPTAPTNATGTHKAMYQHLTAGSTRGRGTVTVTLPPVFIGFAAALVLVLRHGLFVWI